MALRAYYGGGSVTIQYQIIDCCGAGGGGGGGWHTHSHSHGIVATYNAVSDR